MSRPPRESVAAMPGPMVPTPITAPFTDSLPYPRPACPLAGPACGCSSPRNCRWHAGDRCSCASSRPRPPRSEEHTSELQSRLHLVCRLLLEKKKYFPAIIEESLRVAVTGLNAIASNFRPKLSAWLGVLEQEGEPDMSKVARLIERVGDRCGA